MNVLVSLFKKSLLPFVLILFLLAFYIFILLVPIQISISHFFSKFSFPYFLVVLFLYFISFRAKGEHAWFFSACVTVLIFSMQLSYLWISGRSENMIIGGLLPFRDGFNYYSGANFLADGGLLVNMAAWRPMYTSFISSLLVLTQHNLMLSMAILVGLLGIGCYLSARLVRNEFGALAATLFITFLYFYIQNFVGLLYTELLGLSLGCLGFILIWNAAKTQRIVQLVIGLSVLIVAISVRAGTFFVFPMLVLWAGWAFRGQARFSFRVALIAFVTVTLTFFLVNSVFKQFVVKPGGQSFGNFAYTLYGQVVGGAGYNFAIQRFGRQDPAIVYRTTWKFFLNHPLSFFIGTAKAYRDFFFSQIGVFRYYSSSGQMIWSYLIWIAGLSLTIVGLVKAVRKILEPVYSLLIAVFVGFLLSIPFLPPIDGGIRIYASSMPFFFAFAAIAPGEDNSLPRSQVFESKLLRFVEILSILVITLTVIVPIFIQRLSTPPMVEVPICPPDQGPYAVELHQGSFVDILPDEETACGQPLQICASDFQSSSTLMLVDASDAEVYKTIIDSGSPTGTGIRVFAGNDLVSEKPYLFVGSTSDFQRLPDHNLISGCGKIINIKKRPSIFQIETVEIQE
jgi:hypothetical protein